MDSLNDKLTAIREAGAAARAPEVTAVMHRATRDLRDSGAVGRATGVGDRAPLFGRPNLDGRTVRLGPLLRRGPVILSFFRGRW